MSWSPGAAVLLQAMRPPWRLVAAASLSFMVWQACEALVPVVIDDAQRNASSMAKLALRTAGPGALLSRTGSLHGHACSEGRAEASVQGSRARLRYLESPLFEHPTWRLLAMTGACGLVALASRTLVSIEAHDVGPRGFGLEIAWR